MKVLVTGAGGMLGMDLCDLLRERGHQVVAAGRAHLDVTDAPAVKQVLRDHLPDLVFHTAAFTDVDRAEQEPDASHRVNVVGTWNVALACASAGCQMAYVSSGGVFDGRKGAPYTELDVPLPSTQYHRGKLEGERIVASLVREHFILRPGWLFGGRARHRKNFVANRYREAVQASVLQSANDRFGSPTYTRDFAVAALAIVEEQAFGLYHVANLGFCSRYEYVSQCVACCGLMTRVLPISSDHFPRRAPVPAWEALTNYYMDLRGLPPLRPWPEALEDYVTHRLLPDLGASPEIT